MSETSKAFFLPKNSPKRLKAQMIMHILSIILMFDLVGMLKFSIALLIRSLYDIFFGQSIIEYAMQIDPIVYETYGLTGLYSLLQNSDGVFNNILNAISYGGAFLTILIAIILLYFMKKQVQVYLDDDSPIGETITVKKGAYVWLGFLLGMYGGHLFYIRKKRAVMYLIFGLLGCSVPILMYYTTGMSFADAFLAAFMEKDRKGTIEIEDYPYVI